MSRIRTSFRKYPKLVLTLGAAGSAVTAAVITLSGASPAQPTAAQSTAAQSGTVHRLAAAPAVSRPMATLDSAAVARWTTAQRTAQRMLARFGWGKRQWTPLDKLWNRESGWNKYAENPSSGAYGIPQALPGSRMASAGRDWRSNATTQIRWGLRYIKGRYGRPRVAWEHELAYGWY